MNMALSLDNGKYVITAKENQIKATRHGEPWRDLTGDNLIFFLLTHIAELQAPKAKTKTYLIGELDSMELPFLVAAGKYDSEGKNTKYAYVFETLDEAIAAYKKNSSSQWVEITYKGHTLTVE